MNERIQELAEQAKEVVFYAPSTGETKYELNLEKFAELIVKECILRLEKISDDESYSNSDRCILEEACIALEDHFGVER